MASKHSFTAVDFVIFAISLAASCAVGLFYAIKAMRGGNQTNEELLLGGRHMPLLPTTLSLMSSVVSGILILAYPAEIYVLGTAICWSMVGCVLALLIAAAFFVPIFFRSIDSVSAYQYFEERFESSLIRKFASLLFTVKCLVYMSVVLYSPAVALAGVTEVGEWVWILVVGSLCTIYTSIGGLRAVVWTDTIQSFIMYAGLIAMVVVGTQEVGSVERVIQINRDRGRLDGLTNVDPNPFQYMTLWTALFGGMFYWMGTWSTNQMSTQRYISMTRLRDSITIVLLTIPAIVFIAILAFYMGLAMFAFYDSVGCDPLGAGDVKAKDQLVMYFMIELFGDYWGLPGLFLSCLFSGTLSTVSSGINSLSAVGWEEFVRPCLSCGRGKVSATGAPSRGPSDRTATWVTKAIGVGYGLAAMGLAFAAKPLGGIFQATNATLSAIGGPMVGLLLLAVFCPVANAVGSLTGMLVGVGLSMWLFVGALLTKHPKPLLDTTLANCSVFLNSTGWIPAADSVTEVPRVPGQVPFEYQDLYALSFFMYPVVGILATVAVSLIVSPLTGGSDVHKRRPELFFVPWWKPQPKGLRDQLEEHKVHDIPMDKF